MECRPKEQLMGKSIEFGSSHGTSGVLQLRATVKLQMEVSFIIERGGAQVASIG